MAGTPTQNYGFYIGTVGGDIGTWGGLVNSNVTTFLDGILGNVLPVAMSNVDVTLTLSQWQNNGVFRVAGTLTANVNLILPLAPNTTIGTTPAVAGKFIIDNNATGNFKVTVKSAAVPGGAQAVAPQGLRTSMFCDGINVGYADDSRVAKVSTVAGNPNGSVAGSAGNPAAGVPADMIFDTTDQTLFVSGGGTSWISVGQSIPQPGGYPTPVSGQPIITSDSVGATTIYYTPYRGNLCPIFNGSSFVIFSFAELPLVLAAGSQLANGIYDIFAFVNAGVMQIGFGPSWLAGAAPGNVTPGSCARGIGAASTALARLNGIIVNANSMTLNNGATSYAGIAATQATYLGSIAVDATNGQVSSYLSYGGGGGGIIRKRGIWSYFNRVPIIMQGGSVTGSWVYAGAIFRQSNADASNAIMAFTGVAEEAIDITFDQLIGITGGGGNGGAQIGVGQNSTTTALLFAGISAGLPTGQTLSLHAQGVLPPLLGLNQLNTLEKSPTGGSSSFSGNGSNMLHVVRYNG